ncbi:hypothetical protein J6A64_00465 [bacterium]|nr:hypothetical protein [bacterium]MBO5446576.1 hypothetical protein [bacterium]
MATVLLFSDAVTSAYKDTSNALKEVELSDKRVVKKTLTQMMKQSFFHGANRFGTNFIA